MANLSDDKSAINSCFFGIASAAQKCHTDAAPNQIVMIEYTSIVEIRGREVIECRQQRERKNRSCFVWLRCDTTSRD